MCVNFRKLYLSNHGFAIAVIPSFHAMNLPLYSSNSVSCVHFMSALCKCLHVDPTYWQLTGFPTSVYIWTPLVGCVSILSVTLAPSPVDAISLPWSSKYKDLLIGEQIDDYSMKEFSLTF